MEDIFWRKPKDWDLLIVRPKTKRGWMSSRLAVDWWKQFDWCSTSYCSDYFIVSSPTWEELKKKKELEDLYKKAVAAKAAKAKIKKTSKYKPWDEIVVNSDGLYNSHIYLWKFPIEQFRRCWQKWNVSTWFKDEHCYAYLYDWKYSGCTSYKTKKTVEKVIWKHSWKLDYDNKKPTSKEVSNLEREEKWLAQYDQDEILSIKFYDEL